jgi:alanyl-tRNA synthetase
MAVKTLNEIRASFLDYFQSKGHKYLHSSNLVPKNDPSLMFVNAGMVPFKNIFTGASKAPAGSITTSQKCVRAGGKHNDLDNVGYTARHHTFFEMLGNFSFGDYFKEGAIYYAWDFLTEVLKLPKEKLYVTIYHTDDEAARLWKKIAGLSDDRIIRIEGEDNFWSMGDTGPCGPCTEVFYDHGPSVEGGLPGSPEGEGDRYVEIWNMVFMQYDRRESGLYELPTKCIDTGMGLERISTVMQDVHDNYDIDLFKKLLSAIEHEAGVTISQENKFSCRIIADHLRSSCFLIADGVMPSNEGRGYVLRRIMRRAMRHVYHLGCSEALMHKLVPTLVKEMGEAFPELREAENFTAEVLRLEEERFQTTLQRGMNILQQQCEELSKGQVFPGREAFKLYDTYGFPLDLTEDILRAKNITIDIEEFNTAMAEQKQKAKAAWVGSGEQAIDKLWYEIKERVGASEFLGYNYSWASAHVQALVKDGEEFESLDSENSENEEFYLIANQTPFYAESGGQIGDTGTITSNEGVKIEVLDTVSFVEGLYAHKCRLNSGSVKVGGSVDLEIDKNRRDSLKIHHSATHLLHAALREILGSHVTQKGSLVEPNRLRFDFSHLKALTSEEISKIEDRVNQLILNNTEAVARILSMEEAEKQGAMALFEGKYKDYVRVVSMGSDSEHDTYSLELCGGTHVNRTGDIGLFKITSEAAIASGVRRIEAVCGQQVLKLIKDLEYKFQDIQKELKVGAEEVLPKISSLLSEKKNLEKELFKYKKAYLTLDKQALENSCQKVGGIKLLAKKLGNVDAKTLRSSVEEMHNKLDNLVVVYISVSPEGKVSTVVGVSQDLGGKITAPEIAKLAATHLGGSGGGGKANIAQSGGNDISGYEEFYKELTDWLYKF